MSAERQLLALLHEVESRHRDLHQHHQTFKEWIMSHMLEIKDKVGQLVADWASTVADRDAQKARADAAEAKVVDLQAQIDQDDATGADVVKTLDTELTAEQPAPTGTDTGTAPTAPVVTTQGSTTITVDPAAGTTTAVDASAGTTTTLDHTTGATTTTDASGATVQPDPATVQAAQNATTAAGVTAASA